jgi:hypothetical protein
MDSVHTVLMVFVLNLIRPGGAVFGSHERVLWEVR